MNERRIVVIGTSGSGKTTLAKELSTRLGMKHIELDELHWAPNWVEVPDELMRQRADSALPIDGDWVVDGNYKQVRDIVWRRAELIVWLDYSFPTVFLRTLRRTFRRWIKREELWHGNRESLKTTLFSKESILWWVITTHHRRAKEYPALLARPEHSHLRMIRHRSPKACEQWLEKIKPPLDQEEA